MARIRLLSLNWRHTYCTNLFPNDSNRGCSAGAASAFFVFHPTGSSRPLLNSLLSPAQPSVRSVPGPPNLAPLNPRPGLCFLRSCSTRRPGPAFAFLRPRSTRCPLPPNPRPAPFLACPTSRRSTSVPALAFYALAQLAALSRLTLGPLRSWTAQPRAAQLGPAFAFSPRSPVPFCPVSAA